MTTDNQEWRAEETDWIWDELRLAFRRINGVELVQPRDFAGRINALERQSRRRKAALVRIRDDPDYTSAIQRAEEALEGDVDG